MRKLAFPTSTTTKLAKTLQGEVSYHKIHIISENQASLELIDKYKAHP